MAMGSSEERACSRSRIGTSAAHVHERIAMGEEKPLVERFSQEVRRILLGRNERHTKLESLDHIANKEVAPLNVFGTLVIFRVVREVACGLNLDCPCP